MTVILTRLKKSKLNIKNELVEERKKMDEDFGQKYCSRTAKSVYRVGHDKIRLLKWMAYYVEFYENINFFDLMSSVLSCPNETN